MNDTTKAIPRNEIERIFNAAHNAMLAVAESLSRQGLAMSVDDNSIPVSLPVLDHDPEHLRVYRVGLLFGQGVRYNNAPGTTCVIMCELRRRDNGVVDTVGLLALPGVLRQMRNLQSDNRWYTADALPTTDDVTAFVEESVRKFIDTASGYQPPR